MRKCYTRPCNFYYGSYAKRLIANKRALPLAGNPNIAFDQIEIFTRKNNPFIRDGNNMAKGFYLKLLVVLTYI